MKRALVLVVVTLFVIAAAGLVSAAEKARVKQITGEVVTVDAAAKTLTVKGKKAEAVVTTDDKTVVKLGKEKKPLSDVKIGDTVTVKYTEAGGKAVAKSIEIKPAKAAAKAGKKAAEPAKPAEAAKPAPKPAEPAKPAAKPKSGGY